MMVNYIFIAANYIKTGTQTKRNRIIFGKCVFDDFENENHEINHNSQSYIKYSSSVASYDENGNKKVKSVSEVKRTKNGTQKIHKKMITQDENGVVIEEIFPDGTKRTTTRGNNEQKLLPDSE
jgi:hypothetical protein